MDYAKTAAGVLSGVGGEGNVQSVVHCATRLRFVLKDEAMANTSAVRQVPGVITTAVGGGQYQVVIGNEVPEVYAALSTKLKPGAAAAVSTGPKQNLFNRFIGMVSGIFSPLLWVIAGSGLIKACLALSANYGWIDSATPSTEYTVLSSLSDAIFFFLPVALAVTAARYFKANEFTALAIGGTLVYPSLIAIFPGIGAPAVTDHFFGIPMTLMVSYTGSVIPIIIAVWVQSHLERPLYAKLWAPIRRFLTPMIVLLLIVPLTLIVVGPIGTYISLGLSNGINWIFGSVPLIGGAIVGGLWQVLVIFGLHWGLVPVFINEVASNGVSLLVPPVFAAVFGQSAAALAVWIRTRNAARRQLAGPATLSGFMAGITEPAIYGVTLPLRRPFIFGVTGGAVGGAIIAMGGAAANNPAPPSGLGFFPTLQPQGGFGWAVAGALVSIAIALVGTLLTFKEPADEAAASDEVADVEVRSPLDGTVIALSEVNDRAFAEGGLGKGVAIKPRGGAVFAPFDGVVAAAFPTGHAIGLRHASGADLLIHIGIDTVKLDGQHFALRVQAGQQVRAGDLLVEFDRAAIEAAGYDLTTPVVVTNAAKFPTIASVAAGPIAHGDPLYLAVGAEQLALK